jgi:hypothetical protein
VVEAGVYEFQAERVLPVDPAANGVGSLSVGQPLGELQHRDQGQPPRGEGRLAARREQRGKFLVLVDRTEPVG